MTSDETATEHWLQMMRAEYLDMPGLHLTRAQVQRLWGFDGPTCDELLRELEDAKFLRRTPKDVYVLASAAEY